MSATGTELLFVPCPGATPADAACVFPSRRLTGMVSTSLRIRPPARDCVLRCADIRISNREVGGSNSLEGRSVAQRRKHRSTANGSGKLGSTFFRNDRECTTAKNTPGSIEEVE